MFDSNIIPSALSITGYNSLRAAVREGKVTPAKALEAVEAVAKARNGKVSGKLERVLSELRAGKWQKVEPKAESPEVKAEAPAKAQAPETETDDLDGMAWDDLRALGKSLGIKAKSRADYCERIRSWRFAPVPGVATKPAAKAAKADMPDMPSPEVLAGAMKALGAWLAHQQ